MTIKRESLPSWYRNDKFRKAVAKEETVVNVIIPNARVLPRGSSNS